MNPIRMRRRTFVERLGLGAGAALFGPIARSLVAEAEGAPIVRKRAVFVLCGNGLHAIWNFMPTEFNRYEGVLKYPLNKWDVTLPGETRWTPPPMLAPLAPWRNRLLLVDGLANRIPKSQHSAGYGALSCFGSPGDAAAEYGGPPGGITIDQFIAERIGRTTPHRSVLVGLNRRKTAKVTFAAGREQPLPFSMSAPELFKSLFGSSMGGDAELQAAASRRRLLLDVMKDDVKRLEGALAGPEKRKLEIHLAAITAFEEKQKALGQISCRAPAAPIDPGEKAVVPVEDQLEALWSLASLALTCGLTNVLGLAVGTGMSHHQFPKFTRLHVGTQFEAAGGVEGHGHDPKDVQKPAMDLIHGFNLRLMADLIRTLSSVKEGDRTLFDNTVMLYTSDNGDSHHSQKGRWPVVLVGNAGGALKADGRYLAYPSGGRALADLYCSVAHAVGAPTDTFGAGGAETVKGPLAELMA